MVYMNVISSLNSVSNLNCFSKTGLWTKFVSLIHSFTVAYPGDSSQEHDKV